MEFILIIFGIIFSISTIATVIGITMHDIKTARLEKQPFAYRPLISIVVDDDISDKTFKSIKKNNYRNKEIVFVGEQPRGEAIVTLPSQSVLHRNAISRAARRLANDPRLDSIEIVPVLQPPQRLLQLLRLYVDIALLPFIGVRTAFGITKRKSTRWPLLVRQKSSQHTARTIIFRIFSWMTATINALFLVYVCYLAVWLSQPEFLMIYLTAFVIWMAMAIWQYEYFTLRQKLMYFLLLPTSFGAFVVLALYAPLVPVCRLINHIASGLPWRSSRQHVA